MAKKSYIGAQPEIFDLPDGYTQIEYIQSSGTQYINTGVIGKSGLEAYIKWEFTSVGNSVGILGSYKNSTRIYMAYVASNIWRYGYNSMETSEVSVSANTVYNIYSKMYTGEQILQVNGTTILSNKVATAYNTGTYMTLFSYNNNGTATGLSSAKLYKCQILENGITIRNFVPCTNSSGTVGLYDTIHKKFYSNNGTGTFTAGPTVVVSDTAHTIKKMYLGIEEVYTELEYIQTTGTQYINTGFKHNQNTRVKMDVQLTSTGSTTVWLFEGRDANYANRKGVYYYGSSTKKITSAYGASSDNTKAYSATPSARLNIDYNKNVCTINSETQQVTETAFQSASDLYLFACNTEGTISGIASAKLYSCQIYDNGTLIRDYVPVKSSSGAVGLYDKVHGVFYKNDGTGTFTAGAELSNKIYVSIAHKVKKAYIGDANGIARLVFEKEKIPCSISISPTSITLDPSTLSDVINVVRSGSGKITATSSNNSVATVSVSGTTVTVKSVNKTTGSATITVMVAESDDYTGASTQCTVIAKFTVTYHTSKTLSVGRSDAAAASNSNYAIFAGGIDGEKIVDAYNKSLSRTIPDTLSCNMSSHTATSVGSYALFGGGNTGTSARNQTVNAYNTSLVRSTPTKLQYARPNLAATSVGSYALFGGGSSIGERTEVDAYNTSLTRTNATELSVGRGWLAATSVGSYALFGGGLGDKDADWAIVDAYNTSLTRTNATELSVGRYKLVATSNSNYAIFAGGSDTSDTHSNVVDAYNTSLTRIIATALSVGRLDLAATSISYYALFGGGRNYDNNTSYNVVESYDTALTRTAATQLSTARCNFSATSIGNYAIFAGGRVTGNSTRLDTVDVYKI